ncbi:MAG: ABC transporter ATP-binding protein [Sulfobacillus thermosulfidooxidans]|uniref:ABC transporter ATP-binding protein n=1 Tax=Sulfobacillus thermosulfidooxidans TaxID=28034 RepID=A0A2T2X4W4_SULTH|nr:MAG: ABC transporter ATP-binding protein [Sulfobacillus thermosulfidooxidans]
MVSNAIEAVALKKIYPKRIAVNNVSLIVRSGEIFGFLGPNGAGKSTVIKILLGLVSPTAGTARLLGHSYRDVQIRQQIGYLPELFRYPPWLTVHEVLSQHQQLALLPHDPKRIEEVLNQVGLISRYHSRVKSLSKGLQQRLGLAVALIGNPQLLFLDEPTSAMDPLGRHDITQLLKACRAQGRTIFLNSHLLSDMENLCDRVALIDRGEILYTGSLTSILERQTPSYRIFVEHIPQECLTALHAEGLHLRWVGPYWHFPHPRSDLPRLHQILHQYAVSVYEVEEDKRSLEQWFRERLHHDHEML